MTLSHPITVRPTTVRSPEPIETPPATVPVARPERLSYIDAFRGFVMVVMALDHVRSFFHAQAILFEPTDLSQTTPGIFITRWITHICAPAFVLLAGAAANMSMRRGRSPEKLARFLRSRGLWLIVVEFTLVKVGWTFNLDYHTVVGQVIWAIGWGMIMLSFALRMPAPTVLKLGMAGLVLHGLFVLIPSEAMGAARPLWNALFSGEHIRMPGGFDFASKYPVLPWTALMFVGYGAGEMLTGERALRRRAMVRSGVACLAGFAALRWVEMGGRNPAAGALSLLSFIDIEKYPPSLTFFLATIAVTLLLLAAFDRPGGRQWGPLVVFGRVPFFFYVLHIPFIHALAIVAEIASRPVRPPLPMENWRFSLPFVYAVWFSVVCLMYPVCRWFADLKKRRTDVWLSYL